MPLPEEVQSGRKHPLARCEECSLRKHGRYVPSRPASDLGANKELLAVVGEAPGAQESRAGTPFVGPSGRLLKLALRKHGLKQEGVFLTNACLCRPIDNSTPKPDAVAACRPRLLAELQSSGATTVVALGNTAARSLLNTRTGITSLRVGPGYRSPVLPNVRVIPTIHPAAALRHSDSFPDIITDLGKVVGHNGSVSQPYSVPDWFVLDDPDEAIAWLRSSTSRHRSRPVAVDIEVGVDKDTSFDHPNEYDLLCVGLGVARGKVVVIGRNALQHGQVRGELASYLEAVKGIYQNGKFDLAGLYILTRGRARVWFDTMLAHYCLDERPGHHSLEELGVDLLGAPSWKNVLTPYLGRGKNYADIPRDILYEYNAYDVDVTFKLYEYFEPILEAKNLRDLHDFLCDASGELMFPEMNGVAIDKEYLHKLHEEYVESLGDLRKKLQALTGLVNFNPNSPQQVTKWLDKNGVRVGSTNEKTMLLFKDKLMDLPETPRNSLLLQFVEDLLEHRKQAKQHGTYVKGIAKRMYRGRVYTTYLLHGSVTGRLASRNPNLQNITRDSEDRPSIRRMFVPSREENVFVNCDYRQAELRVMACLAEEPFLRGIFLDPSRSIHKEFATQLYGQGWSKQQYIRTKAYVFGLSYGREAPSIAQEYKIPVDEAKRGMDLFFNAIPKVVEWRDRVRRQVKSGDDLVTPFGRHRRFWLITNDNWMDIQREALAFLPQSTASDICLSAAVALRRRLRGMAHLRLTVYDSILFECHRDKAEEVAAAMQEEMAAAAARVFDYVPFTVDTGIGRSWADV